MAQLVAGAMRHPRPGPSAGDDLIQAFQRQRLAPARSLQHHEQPISGRVGGPLVVHVGGDGGKEAGRHRHQALMSALALSDEHPPLAQVQVLQVQPDHLGPAQPAQRHSLDHRPVPVSAQCVHQGGQLLRVQDARQTAHRPHQRLAPQLTASPARRQTPGHRVRLHPHITAGDQIAIKGRNRRQPAADRRARQS
jgi:hypothetical protein